MRLRGGAALLLAALLSACAGGVIPPGANSGPPPRRSEPAPTSGGAAARPVPATPRPALPASPVPPDATNAAGSGVQPGPALTSLEIPADQSRRALEAFRKSCPSLVKRTDQAGLTTGSDWQQACSAAASWPAATATEFFVRYFEAVQVGTGAAFATGYYEPEIAGSRTHLTGYDVPVYGRPRDLIEVDLGLFSDDLKGKKIRGKVAQQSFVPYEDRAQIVDGALDTRAPVIAWAKDEVEFFFLQIQGSGRLVQPDGTVMRIGYDTQNGRDYTGIGKLMKDRGLIQAGSMQDIMQYLRSHPAEGRAIMNENKSFVFFRELTGPGPLGAMGIALTPGGSVAADPKFIPLGAPVLLSMDRAEPNGIWIAQDTGGAIKGANRVDTFWGAGQNARAVAGGMSARGSALLLVPIGTYARLASANGWPLPASR